jgi:hypothetical protein
MAGTAIFLLPLSGDIWSAPLALENFLILKLPFMLMWVGEHASRTVTQVAIYSFRLRKNSHSRFQKVNNF